MTDQKLDDQTKEALNLTERFLRRLTGGNSHASYEGIRNAIHEFDRSLDDEHEVGVALGNFGKPVTVHVLELGHSDSLLIVKGTTEQGNPVELIQNINQLSLMLVKVRRPNPSVPKQPIGLAVFRSSSNP